MNNISVFRSANNPVLVPSKANLWEASASFNPSLFLEDGVFYCLYRAISAEQDYNGQRLELSTIGYASSFNGADFDSKRQLIKPEEDYERFGCEDPRFVMIDDEFLITYTAISAWPPSPESIKVAVAFSDDLGIIKERHLVTPFNAKAMAFFPEKINGKYVAVLTVHTDQPPSKIAIAFFEKRSDIYDPAYWQDFYAHLDEHTLAVSRLNSDQVEVGAVPVKTADGWVLIYSHIQNYYNQTERIFGVEALLLDLNDPRKIVGRTTESLFSAQESYEKQGEVANVVFPSGAVIVDDEFRIYYGAADTVGAFVSLKLAIFLSLLKQSPYKEVVKLQRFANNPILVPKADQAWQAQAVFNSAAIYLNNKIYLLYRAMSMDNTSTIGCAISEDGFAFNDLAYEPVYVPRMDFETKKQVNGFSGCEDPRLTVFGDRIYMFYTAYEGISPPKVALSSISIDDFTANRWLWQQPIAISNPDIDDKNACLFPEKINDRFVILHRAAGHDIAIDYVDSLEDFASGMQLEKEGIIPARPGHWDGAKIGIAAPPIKTEKGWLLIYHGVSEFDRNYRLGYLILDLQDPFRILYRSEYPILEPETDFEKFGIVNNVVFSCGAVLKDDQVFVYYGGADKVMAVATAPLKQFLDVFF